MTDSPTARLAVSRDGVNVTAPGGVERIARYGSSQFVEHNL
jgi:hypothetical protein